MIRVLTRVTMAPKRAWEYAQREPLEAFCYGGLCVVFAWGAKIFLSILALVLMSGAIYQFLSIGNAHSK